MLAWLGKILTGGVLDRILDTVDRRVEAQLDRDNLKAELIREHLRTRSDFMRSGGFVLMLLFAVPLAAWWAAVLVYSILWCQGCAYPQEWSIAALPAPLDEWAGGIVVAIFGVIGLARFK
jgi:hypothetical protein